MSRSYIHILFHILSHYGLSHDAEYSSLCYTVGPCCLSHSVDNGLHLLTPNSQSDPLPPLPTWQPPVSSLMSPRCCFCFIDRFIFKSLFLQPARNGSLLARGHTAGKWKKPGLCIQVVWLQSPCLKLWASCALIRILLTRPTNKDRAVPHLSLPQRNQEGEIRWSAYRKNQCKETARVTQTTNVGNSQSFHDLIKELAEKYVNQRT